MKAKNKFKKIVLLIFTFLMIAIVLYSGTYARYASSASGTSSTMVAEWSFEVNGKNIAVLGDNKAIDFNLFDTIYDTDETSVEQDVKEGLIAPGTAGAFEFLLKNTSEVTTSYNLNISLDNTNIPLEFCFDGEEWLEANGIFEFQNTLGINETENLVVKWRWPYGEDIETDIALGGQSVTVTADITAYQGGVSGKKYVEKPIFETMTTEYDSTKIASGTSFKYQYAPFAYQNVNLYAGKTISKIGIPIKSVSSLEEKQYFTLYTVKKEPLASKQKTTITNEYKIEVPLAGYTSETINDWVYIDLRKYNIKVAEDETLAFTSPEDTIQLSYHKGSGYSSNYIFYSKVTSTVEDCGSQTIFFDVYYLEEVVNTTVTKTENKPIFKNMLTDLPNSKFGSLTNWTMNYAPFAYANTELFAGKKITKIGLPVKKVSAINDEQTFTINVVDKNKIANRQKADFLRTYILKPKASDLGTNADTVNKWIYVDTNIQLSENETLAFGDSEDTVILGYGSSLQDNDGYGFWARVNTTSYHNFNTEELYFDIYYEEKVIVNDETKTIKDILTGKNLSIMGDSISTYPGYSNNATTANSTTGDNKLWYTGSNAGVTSVNDTWWMQTATETGMNLLVNNSSSGAKVVGKGNVSGSTVDQGIGIRPENLHDNIGDNNGVKPDVIMVFMGINDLNANYTSGSYKNVNFNTLITDNGDGTYTYQSPANFAEGYAIMLHKIKTNYPNADVFLMNMPLRSSSASQILLNYNQIISDLATHYEMNLIDLFNSEISGSNYSPNSADGLHPNQSGMDLMTNAVVDALEEKYLK